MTSRKPLTTALLAALLALTACQQHQQSGQGDSPQQADGVIPDGAIPAAPDHTPGLEGTNAPGAVQSDSLPPVGGAGADTMARDTARP